MSHEAVSAFAKLPPAPPDGHSEIFDGHLHWLTAPCDIELRVGRAQMNTQVNPVPLALETEHTEGDGREMFKAVCKLGLEGIVSNKLDAPYKSGPSKAWLKIKNPKAPAATRAIDGTF